MLKYFVISRKYHIFATETVNNVKNMTKEEFDIKMGMLRLIRGSLYGNTVPTAETLIELDRIYNEEVKKLKEEYYGKYSE